MYYSFIVRIFRRTVVWSLCGSFRTVVIHRFCRSVFTARRYAKRVYAVVVCLSVCVCVCHTPVLQENG